MRESFIYKGTIPRIVFGAGTITRVADELNNLGRHKALILSTPNQEADARTLANGLGTLCVGVFSGAVMHTPVEVTLQALQVFADTHADCIISLGGGSTIGLGKAIAYKNNADQLVVATTYAGSEVTPILGQTEAGIKTTVRDLSVLPETVIYDPELTYSLPVSMTMTSGLNAIAHAVEGLYAQDRNPISSMMAMEGIAALHRALPAIAGDHQNPAARSDALYGSWLCGVVLGNVGMALHHKMCHTLGGSFDLPHAETHAILLPHTVAYTEAAVPHLLEPVAALMGSESAATGLFDFARTIGAPSKLQDLGLTVRDLDKAAEIALRNPYWNPRPLETLAIREMLQKAFEGARPRQS
ncbi:maleylacetate reductase [Agrobacterium salinitolerans]|uniref:maleylacetate reductase n=1 Tax=Agrobacterium salinitolerans TaxID=1183413 RepID=UPI00098E9843|nr:maleylacetate reductase [Agrobacterium salinitolerans]OOO27735.1 maleylacetate reductase [Agrobacterium salinitolerans]PNQ25638.1 maleylacetate reductase [Rhizobium sp. YIC5082]